MCTKCEGMEGWIETASGGLKRCNCAKPAEAPRDPVIRAKDVEVFVEMLGNLPYMPLESGARLLIGEEIRSLCRDEREALWLVTRMNRLYTRWPGLAEMRRVYCAALVPLDGVLQCGTSEVYPDGIPSEQKPATLALAAPNRRVLMVGAQSADPEMDAAVKQLAKRKGMR